MPTPTSPYDSTDKLASLIQKRRQVLLQLRELGRREQASAADGETTLLLQLASAKQHLVTALQLVERQLAPYHDEDPDRRVWRSPAERQACADCAEECRSLLAEVVALEQAHEQAMVARRDAAAKQLRDAGQASRAAGAYQQHSIHSAGPPTPHLSPQPDASGGGVSFESV